MKLRRISKCVVAFFALAAAACGGEKAGADADPNRTVRKGRDFVTGETTQKGGFFYRLEAHYAVKETGEPIDFDFVVACNIRTTNYSYTGPSFVAERYPEVMAKATSDGHAVMIKTPRICQQIELDRGYVPADFVPFAIWFDDVDDLSFGWGYATQDAYEGPNAKISYRPTDPEKGTYTAKITRVTRAEWEAWRGQAVEDWVQIGALPGPWGYADPQDEAGINERDRVRALNGGKWLANHCSVLLRLALPPDAMALIEEAAMKSPTVVTDQFIVEDGSPSVIEASSRLFERGRNEPIYGGFKVDAAYQDVEGTQLRPPAVGSIPRERGTHHHGYRETYPRVAYDEPPYNHERPDQKGSVSQVLIGAEWLGFAGCGNLSGVRRGPEDEYSETGWRLTVDQATAPDRVRPLYRNNQLLFENTVDLTRTMVNPRLFERTGYRWSLTSVP